ncbi:MAG TPA: lipocalin family protein, partial [Minicystis sp.]|nr:lipocalin family protein [Minicystis sp.]
MPRFAAAVVAAALALALPACSSDPPLDVAPNVDLAQFSGRWFEIAKLPRVAEAKCTNTVAVYTVRDGGLDIDNQCNDGAFDGPVRKQSMRASVAESTSQLTLTVAGFSGDYWILEVGPQYEYAMIGVPSRDYLWILSRTPTLDAKTLDALVAHAKDKKFDVSRLE